MSGKRMPQEGQWSSGRRRASGGTGGRAAWHSRQCSGTGFLILGFRFFVGRVTRAAAGASSWQGRDGSGLDGLDGLDGQLEGLAGAIGTEAGAETKAPSPLRSDGALQRKSKGPTLGLNLRVAGELCADAAW